MSEVFSAHLERVGQHWTFLDGSERWAVELKTEYFGKGIYKPGWRWSKHVEPQAHKPSERHRGYVESGRMVIQGSDGDEREVGPGEAFDASPNHDAWVLGEVPCVAYDWGPIEK